MEKMRFGVIGALGVIGKTHIEAIEAVEDAQLAAVCDVDAEKGKELAKEKGVPFFHDWEALVKSDAVDAVTLCTPHPLHRPMAVAALEAGKHVLTEKPMAAKVSDADKMAAAAKRTGKVLAVVYQSRFSPAAIKAKELLDAGELGHLYRTFMDCTFYKTMFYYRSAAWRGTWKGEEGGVLYNQAPHPLDLFQHLGGMPKRVRGFCRTTLHAIEVEDVADAYLEYAGGCLGLIHTDVVQSPAEFKLAFYGDKAALTLGARMKFSLVRNTTPVKEFSKAYDGPNIYGRLKTEPVEVELPEAKLTGHAAHVADLIAAVRAGKDPLVTGEEGTKSVELANAITLSSFKDKWVELPIDRDEYDQLLQDLISGKIEHPAKA